MQVIEAKVERDLVVDQDTEIKGQVVGNVSVTENTRLRLTGMIIGQLYCKRGSNVIISGTVIGDVINEGGSLRIFGTINGSVDGLKGLTRIDANAHIQGLPR